MVKLLPILASAFLAAPLAAASAAPAQDQDAKPAKKERLICKYVGETGTRTRGTKICLRSSDWAERTRRLDAEKGMEEDGERMFRSRVETPTTANPR